MLRRSAARHSLFSLPRTNKCTYKAESFAMLFQSLCLRHPNSSYDQKEWHVTQDAPHPDPRNLEIANKRIEYEMLVSPPHVPPLQKTIPVSEYQWPMYINHLKNFWGAAKAQASLCLMSVVNRVMRCYVPLQPFDRFDYSFTSRHGHWAPPPPQLYKHWQSDEEFALHRMQGMNPYMIRLVKSLDDEAMKKLGLAAEDPVTKELKELKYTVKKLCDEKRLFVCDFKELTPVLPLMPVDRNPMAPVALFYHHPKTDTLLPLAIKLGQQDSPNQWTPETFPIFTPDDPEGAWALAKYHVQIADAAILEVNHHLLATHYVGEQFYQTMNRNVSVQHPISAWLTPHFFYTININYNARTKLISADGVIPAVLQMGYPGTVGLLQQSSRNFKLDHHNVRHSIKTRGLDTEHMKGMNRWAEDALKVWDIVGQMCEEMVNVIYKSDEDVAKDTEIRDWIAELNRPQKEVVAQKDGSFKYVDPDAPIGMGMKFGTTVDGTPITAESIVKSRKNFAEFLQHILWLQTGAHATGNNGAYDIYGWLPWNPWSIKLDANPRKVDIPAWELDRAMLPGDFIKGKAIDAIAFVRLLTLPMENDDHKIMTGYNGPFFQQAHIKPVVAKFHQQLQEVSTEIDQRNLKTNNSYNYMNPNQMGLGIYQ